jgi:hypothetical protein
MRHEAVNCRIRDHYLARDLHPLNRAIAMTGLPANELQRL